MAEHSPECELVPQEILTTARSVHNLHITHLSPSGSDTCSDESRRGGTREKVIPNVHAAAAWKYQAARQCVSGVGAAQRQRQRRATATDDGGGVGGTGEVSGLRSLGGDGKFVMCVGMV